MIKQSRFMLTERRLRGAGKFILKGGSQLEVGLFHVEQISSGRTFLRVERGTALEVAAGFRQLEGFEGDTSEGRSLQIKSPLTECVPSRDELCFAVRDVRIGSSAGHFHELMVTNLFFPSTHLETIPEGVNCNLTWGDRNVRVRVSPIRRYTERLVYIRQTRGIATTAKITFHAPALTGEDLSDFIGDLCHSLSLVQGRKINWIYHASYAARRRFCEARFGETITKTYSPLPLCYSPNVGPPLELPLTAIQEAIPGLKKFCEQFDQHRRVINAWLDARIENDYLEARTLKFVVVIEAIKTLITRVDKTILSTMVDPAVWEKQYGETAAALNTLVDSANQPSSSSFPSLANWNKLNSRPFAEVLADICAKYSLLETSDSIKAFGRIRNSIVHRFQYDGKLKLVGPWTVLNSMEASQHFFVGAFVDRVLLRLLGLSSVVDSPSNALDRNRASA